MTAIVFLILRIILGIFLYLILFLLFYFLWKENKNIGLSILQRNIPPITLNLISKENDSKMRVFYSEEITIGRSSNCDWQLPDEVVSNFHSRLRYHHMQWWIEDLKSKNGTYINGFKVVTPTVLTSGDEISIGNNLFELSVFNVGEMGEEEINSNAIGELDE
jgi:pSer/pThr/pTyr-binding forkhead associated (FHA) protein